MTSDRVVTPEAVALDLETANVGSRLLAFALDLCVVTAVSIAMVLVFAQFGTASSISLPFWLVFSVISLLTVGWYFGYFVGSETLWRGRTLGKAALGLRVVTKEGGQIRFRHALLRAILGLVDFALGSGFVAVVSILATRNNQRLGDLVAGTLVLRERTGASAPRAVSFTPPPGLEPYTAMLDTSRVTARSYQAARSFLLRAPSLLPDARDKLAVRLADQLAALVTPPPPQGVPAAEFLAAVAAAYQRRQERAAPTTGQPPLAGPTPLAPPAPNGTPPSPAQPERAPGGFVPPD